MDQFSLTPEKKVNRKPLLWNILTVVVLLSICCLLYYILSIFINPYVAYNPFPPEALPTRYSTETPTITPIPPPATWTGTATIEPSATRTRAPTWTLLPGMITPSATETPTNTPTEGTPTETSTPMPASAEVKYETSTSISTHATQACTWMGVGGKVVKASGDVLPFMTIQLGGTLDGQPISRATVSGNAPAYGASGFEFSLGDHPIASTGTLWIQLLDETGKNPLSEKIYFDTYDDCEQNLVMITFTKNR